MLVRSLSVLSAFGIALATVGVGLHTRVPMSDERSLNVAPANLLPPGQRVVVPRRPAADTRVVALLDVPAPLPVGPPAARLKGGGFDIDPRLHAPTSSPRVFGLEIRRLIDGSRRRMAMPDDAWIHDAHFTADGRRLALDVARPDGLCLWLVRPETGEVQVTDGARLSAVWGDACDWRDVVDRVLCRVVAEPENRGRHEAPPLTATRERGPDPPSDRDSLNQTDFRNEFTVQLAFFDLTSGDVRRIGRPGLYELANLAPGGRFILVGRTALEGGSPVRRQDLRRTLEVWTSAGALKRRLPDGDSGRGLKLATWDPSRPARLVWTQESKGDRPGGVVLAMEPPFTGPPSVVFRATGTVRRLSWSGNVALFVTEEDAPGGHLVTWMVAARGGAEPRKVWDGGNNSPH